MSDAADSTLNTVKALLGAFKTGATPAAMAAKSTADPACLPPKFPVPPKEDTSERGRLPATKMQVENNYARQCLEALAPRAPRASGQPALDCTGSLHISLFFDGTCNNEQDADDEYGTSKSALTSIGKLYHAANWQDVGNQSPREDGYFSYYFPGCGARFPQIREDEYTLTGELFANGGEDRINQALLKTFGSIVYAVRKTRLLDSTFDMYREKMATTWPVSMVTKNANRKSAIAAFSDQYLGKVVPQWPQQPTREYIQTAQKRIPKIKLFVYGYCRGAATARVFARWLEELLDKAPMPADVKAASLPAGSEMPSGPTLMGIPISIEFLGLMDTVSSVGVPHILPSATGHLGWAANNLHLPTTPGFVKSCYHFVAGHEQHGDLPLDSIRGADGKYPAGAVEVVYPGVHADVGGDCKPEELGKTRTGTDQLLSQIALHDMYAAAFDAGAPLSVPKDVLPKGLEGKSYRVMQGDVVDQFKIAKDIIISFNVWQADGAKQDGDKTAADAAKSGEVNDAAIAAIAIARGDTAGAATSDKAEEIIDKEIKQAHAAAETKAAAAKKEAQKKEEEARATGKLPDPVYVPLKAKALEVILADQISWITGWRTERFVSPEATGKHYSSKPFYTNAKNDGTGASVAAQPAEQSSGPRPVPLIDKDRLDRAAGEYHRSHTGLLAMLGQVALDVIPTTETDQLGGKVLAPQESGYMQIKKSGDARRPALMASPEMMDFYDNYVHDTVAKYNHDPLHSSLTHGYFAPRTVYDHDDDRWDSVKQFGQRINAVVHLQIGDVLKQARTDMDNPATVSGVLGKIFRDIKSGAFKTLRS